MRNRLLLLLSLVTIAMSGYAADAGYHVTIDLTKVENDRVKVEVIVPAITSESAIYCIPKIVPGTYSIYDFGRFIYDLKAYDAENHLLQTEPVDVNQYRIIDAEKLYKLVYWVDDTYDMTQDNIVFEPCGTNIQNGENFIVNTFGFAGYIEGMKNIPFELTIKKPSNFYGSTAMIDAGTDNSSDTYELSSYDNLADSPLLYGIADTAIKKVGNAEVLIGIYSPNKKLNARQIMNEVSEILEAQAAYLGGKLPVNKYAFLIYFTDSAGVSGSLGALEHRNSSMYFLPEDSIQNIAPFLRNVCAHDFFHIVTPLTIHSEEIGDFNFINPDMSEHLWLYEGQTEYAAHHAQVRAGLITVDEFLNRMSQKIATSQNYYSDTLPFTVMSLHCLDTYKEQYGNVYQKGALINMCLDIELRRLSGGKYGTQELMRDLGKFYGKDKSFQDEELFDKITSLTYPQIREFFALYVEGDNAIPYEKYLGYAGIIKGPSTTRQAITLGNISLNYDFTGDSRVVTITDLTGSNAFAQDMGYVVGDRLVSLNGESLTEGDPNATIDNWKAGAKPGDKVIMIVERKDENGNVKRVKLKGKAMQIDITTPGTYAVDPNATAEQVALRKAWLGY